MPPRWAYNSYSLGRRSWSTRWGATAQDSAFKLKKGIAIAQIKKNLIFLAMTVALRPAPPIDHAGCRTVEPRGIGGICRSTATCAISASGCGQKDPTKSRPGAAPTSHEGLETAASVRQT